MFPANELAVSLKSLAAIAPFRTVMPARVNARSANCPVWSRNTVRKDRLFSSKVPNNIIYVILPINAGTKNNFDNLRSPLYGGKIDGVTRYCPSIEDKSFARGEERHQVFIELCGADTEELTRVRVVLVVAGRCPDCAPAHHTRLECRQIMRTAYAIE